MTEPSDNLLSILRNICGADWYVRQQPRRVPSEELVADPSGEVFRALFTIEEIQEIQDAFAEATGVASIITTTEGVPITTPSRFCDLCQNVIRKTERGRCNCFHSDAVIGRHNPDGPIVQPCLSGGLWDAGSSITAGRIHIANWLIGQVRQEDADLERMARYADDIGADRHEFLTALDKVTVMSVDQFKAVSKALFLVANQMSERAFQNLQQTHLMGEMNRLKQLVERSPVVIFQWANREGWPVEFVSENVVQLTEFSRGLFLSADVVYTDIISPSDVARVSAEVRAAVEDPETGEFAHQPYRLITRTGQVKWVTDHTRIIRDSQGQVVSLEGIVIDITERKQHEQEREEMRAKLERAGKLELIGTIAGGVAHDLNNMLGAILGYPDILLPDLSPDDPVYKPLVAMQKSAERAAEVVQDLLTLARRGVVQKEVLCLNDVVRQYLDSPELSLIRKEHPQAQLESNLAPDLMNVSGSVTHLSKLLMNLVNNGCEALKQSGRVMVSTRNQYVDDTVEASENVAEGDYVVLRVEDTGIGMAPADIERIFEPFYTTKKMGMSGTGLGMSVVWGTVKDHDGYITVESRLGLGSVFEVYLPVERQAAATPPLEYPEDLRGHGERVLIIDDIELQRDVAASMATSLGYAVQKVASGEEAVELLKTQQTDVLLLDMIMPPGIDGLETYRRILRLHPGQRALITSGYSETDRVKETQRLGASGYLRKPFTRQALGRAIKTVLGAR